MTGIILLSLCSALGILCIYYGHDSRETVRSKEHDFAAYGINWENDPKYDQELADELEAALCKVRAKMTTDTPAPRKAA